MIDSTLCYIEHDGKYLMLYRNKKKNDVNGGKYVGVGGKFEKGETADECVLREVFEETGITLMNSEGLELMEVDDNPTKENQTILFRYRYIVSGKNQISGYLTDKYSEPDEIADIKWIPIKKVRMYDWTSDNHMSKIYEYSPVGKKGYLKKFWELISKGF